MTGLWSSCLALSVLVILRSAYCTRDTTSLDEADFMTSNQVNHPSEIQAPGYSNEDDDSLRNLLTMASKRFDDQTFFPVRGKKGGLGSYTGMGLHSARRQKALSDLMRLVYYHHDQPFLLKLNPAQAQLSETSRGGNKRLDSFSFFGVRGKRPYGWKTEPYGDAERINTYLSDIPIKDVSSQAASLKRQPPPGFYGIRG